MSNPTTAIICKDKWQHLINLVNKHHTPPEFPYKKISLQRFLLANILIFFLQYIGFLMGTPPALSPFWFASGAACGFIFIRGTNIIPGIFFGSLLAFAYLTQHFCLSFLIAFIYTLHILLLLRLTHYYIGPTIIYIHQRQLAKFILCCAILTAVFSISLNRLLYSTLNHLCLLWWLGDFGGIIIFACALVTWDHYFPEIEALKHMNKLMLFKYSLLWSAIFFLLLIHHSSGIYMVALILTTIPILFLISFKLGWCGTMAAIFIFALFINLSAYLDILFLNNWPSMQLFIQVTLLIEAIVGLLIAQGRRIPE